MLTRLIVLFVASIAIDLTASTTSAAQNQIVRVDSIAALSGELMPGDRVIVTQVSGAVLRGKLIKLGDVDFEMAVTEPHIDGQPEGRTLAIPLGSVLAIERLPDSTRNGALTGAAIGAGAVLGMFIWALSVDRNEFDEWGQGYLAAGAVASGLGALIGWAADAAHSKPPVRFEVIHGPSGTRVPDTQPTPRVVQEAPWRRFTAEAGVALLGNAAPLYVSQGVPVQEGRTIANGIAAMSVGVGAFVTRNMSVWGELTELSPSGVDLSGFSLCEDRFDTCTPLTLANSPDSTDPEQHVANWSLRTHIRPGFSGLVRFHTSGERIIRWTLVAGVTVMSLTSDYQEQRYSVMHGGLTPIPTYNAVGRPYVSHDTFTQSSLALGGNATIRLFSRRMAVVPNVRYETAPKGGRVRVGAGLQWMF